MPDFKARLTRLRKDKGTKIPGFGAVNRKGQKNEKINVPIPDLEKWFDDNQEEMENV